MYDFEIMFFYLFCEDQSTILPLQLYILKFSPEKTEVLNNSLTLSMRLLAGGRLNKWNMVSLKKNQNKTIFHM